MIDASLAWGRQQEDVTRLGVCSHPAVVAFYKKHGFFSEQRPIVCIATSDPQDLEAATTLLAHLDQYISQPDLLELAVFEMMAKVIAYRDLPKGYEFKIPTLGLYRVDEVFDLWNGMPAFGLVSKEGCPLLLFRGTDPTIGRKRGVASMVTDLDPRGPGYSVYLRARPQLRSWLQAHPPARAIGQSLGGALAAYTVLWESDLLHPTQPSVACNPPGFFRQARRLWDRLQERAPLITYITEGDAISRIGTVVGDIRRIGLDHPCRGPIEAHVALTFAPQDVTLS